MPKAVNALLTNADLLSLCYDQLRPSPAKSAHINGMISISILPCLHRWAVGRQFQCAALVFSRGCLCPQTGVIPGFFQPARSTHLRIMLARFQAEVGAGLKEQTQGSQSATCWRCRHKRGDYQSADFCLPRNLFRELHALPNGSFWLGFGGVLSAQYHGLSVIGCDKLGAGNEFWLPKTGRKLSSGNKPSISMQQGQYGSFGAPPQRADDQVRDHVRK